MNRNVVDLWLKQDIGLGLRKTAWHTAATTWRMLQQKTPELHFTRKYTLHSLWISLHRVAVDIAVA